MSRYDTVKRTKVDGVERYGTSEISKYEEKNSDLLLIATYGDRCDLLSQKYYGTPELWWYIASVNNLSSNSIEAGIQLRIPVSIEQAILK